MSEYTLAEKIAVMQAALEGRQIELRLKLSRSSNGSWLATQPGSIAWNWADFDFRIKPKSVRYKRYISTACYQQIPSVFCMQYDTQNSYAPEKEAGFIQWIDKEWQTFEY